MTARRLVFITSLERSGSTLLDLTLGRHPRFVSFGEVARVLKPHGTGGIASVVDRPCSCGAAVRECAFWGPVTRAIADRERELSLAERYALFLAQFQASYGEEAVPVDSSKFLTAMDALHDLAGDGGLDLRVLFTVRDVRGWIASCRRADRRKREIPYATLFSRQIAESWRPYLRYNVLRHVPFWIPLEWYIRNRTIERFLARRGLAVKRLSYERLALETERTVAGLYEFLGVEPAAATPGVSHIVRGNRMAFDPEKNAAIRYDAQWLSELWPQYEAMAWPFVMRQNVRWVYDGEAP